MSIDTDTLTQTEEQTNSLVDDAPHEHGQHNGSGVVEANDTVLNDDLLDVLERSAYAQDHYTFLDRIEGVDWSARPPEHMLKAIDMALLLGGVARLAMDLAQESVRLFPDHPKCQWAARVIAPAKIIGTSPATGRDRSATYAWIRAHAKQYRMQWVAVRDGKLLGASRSLDELDEMIKDEEDPNGILVTKVV